MKRKQKTPRRLRPTDISAAEQNTEHSQDLSNHVPPDDSPKRQKFETETQTSVSSNQTVMNITQPADSLVDRKFNNESEGLETPTNVSDIKIQAVCSSVPGTFRNEFASPKSQSISDRKIKAVTSITAKPDALHDGSFRNESASLKSQTNGSYIKIQSVPTILPKPGASPADGTFETNASDIKIQAVSSITAKPGALHDGSFTNQSASLKSQTNGSYVNIQPVPTILPKPGPLPTDGTFANESASLNSETNGPNIKIQAVTSIASTPDTLHHGIFRNEPESPGMPSILNVYSISEFIPQQTNATPKQNDSFPVTPPCSPPLIHYDTLKNPIVSQYYQYQNGPVLSTSNIPQQMVVLGDPPVQYYNASEVMADNPNRIANGVLPWDRQTHLQAQHHQAKNNRVNYYNAPLNHNGNPIDQLRQMFTLHNKYLVSKESTIADRNKLYTRFKMQDKPKYTPNRQTFPQGPLYDWKLPKRIAVRPKPAAENQENRITMPSSSSAVGSEAEMGGLYKVVLQDNGDKNEFVEEGPATTKVNTLPTMMNLYQEMISPQTSDSEPAMEKKSDSNEEGEDALTYRDVKVQKLKKLLVEQLETLKKLRTNQ